MTKTKITRKEREEQLQRKWILDAAAELFSASGYNNVSIHEIAKKAEFGIGTLYKFFNNKEDLYKALIVEKARKNSEVLNEILLSDDDVMAIIGQYLIAKYKAFKRDGGLIRLYFAEVHGAGFNLRSDLCTQLREIYEKRIQMLASVFERGIKEGVFRPLDSCFLARSFAGITNIFLLDEMFEQGLSERSFKTTGPFMKDVFLNGVLTESARKEVCAGDDLTL